ncbi:uncharacterized protein B0H64DRAFT_471146 [Chaetomium fimeti]|uniref:VPS37 C-terminal domain-containing protein n=1 Tax=Chaetomium fimeti TaxID=1854472 RepID=A0AAE0HR71_9PEZI|nr:hypothetical protein B0H64DRAFT_471146 [Chaetomium fimeti]
MYAHTPPAPPPKPPGTHDVSRMSTPAGGPAPPPPPLPEAITAGLIAAGTPGSGAEYHNPQDMETADPGDQWLPKFLEDKSKNDLALILSNPTLLTSLTHAPQTMHPSLQRSHTALTTTLTQNMSLASHLLDLESHLAHQRASAQAQLLATHALERQWRARQADMDHALARFAPASLYQRLAGGVAEQEGVCGALEESFLDGESGGWGGGGGDGNGDGGVLATEREVAEWVRRYREAKKLFYLRQERRERWDEGRVGGWR